MIWPVYLFFIDLVYISNTMVMFTSIGICELNLRICLSSIRNVPWGSFFKAKKDNVEY